LSDPAPADLQHIVNWVVKASKLCNLRCRYCYEWNDLGNPQRISLRQWERLLEAVLWYHGRRRRRSSGPFRSYIIWHGGEPLLLPPAYIREVMRLQRALFAAELRCGDIVNVLQTNLYRVSDEHLDLLESEGIQLGVSMDVAGGVRLDARGRETERRVAENIDRLLARDIHFGGIAVLAAHTRPRLRAVYEFYEGLEAQVRILPLFDAPLNVPGASFWLSEEEMVAALQDLFRFWLARRRPVPVHPFVEYVRFALDRARGLQRPQYDRARHGEWALLVNTDGSVYQVGEAYDAPLALGNVFTRSLAEILRSPAYADSLARDARERKRVCGPCEFAGSCSTLPLFESRRRNRDGDRCAIAHPMHAFVEGVLREHPLSRSRLARLLGESRAAVIARRAASPDLIPAETEG
jgi:uncharacterized protein